MFYTSIVGRIRCLTISPYDRLKWNQRQLNSMNNNFHEEVTMTL